MKTGYRSGFVGTGNHLSAIPIALISNEDSCFVDTENKIYFYKFNSSATDATSSPERIRPNDYSTAGVWYLAQNPYPGLGQGFGGILIPGTVAGLDVDGLGGAGLYYSVTDGQCMDTNNLVLGTHNVGTMDKIVNTAWAAGGGNGGLLDATAVTGSFLYLIYALIKDSDGSIDFGHAKSTTSVSSYLPTGYSKYRVIDFFMTDSSGHMARHYTLGRVHTNLEASKNCFFNASVSGSPNYSNGDGTKFNTTTPTMFYLDHVLPPWYLVSNFRIGARAYSSDTRGVIYPCDLGYYQMGTYSGSTTYYTDNSMNAWGVNNGADNTWIPNRNTTTNTEIYLAHVSGGGIVKFYIRQALLR